MAKTTITPSERLELIGLMTLANRHHRILDEIEKVMEEIIQDNGGDVADAIYSTREPEEKLETLLARLKITVGPPAAPVH